MNELYEKLTRLQELLHKHQVRSQAEGGPMADITRGQGRILAFLKLHDSISVRDLSYLLGMTIPTLNEMLAKLEKIGYVILEPMEEDKQVMLVKLTVAGRAEERLENADSTDIFACLSDDDKQVLGAYIDRITESYKMRYGDARTRSL
jgi:DNA-binding MarR family transcriptional regulator